MGTRDSQQCLHLFHLNTTLHDVLLLDAAYVREDFHLTGEDHLTGVKLIFARSLYGIDVHIVLLNPFSYLILPLFLLHLQLLSQIYNLDLTTI